MIDRLPCPIPGCNHSRTGPEQHFSSKSTLLRHLNLDDHQTTFYLADQSICTAIDIYSCTQHSCPTTPTRFFHSLNQLTLHNALHHPPPIIHSPSTTDPPSPTLTNTLDIATSIFYADSENGSHNLWHLGTPSFYTATHHQSSPTQLPKQMAPKPQTPQPLERSPPTSPHHSNNHQHIIWYGASLLGGARYYINNPTLRLKHRRVFTFGALGES